MEKKKLGRPTKYYQDMVYVSAYIPKKLKGIIKDLQEEKQLVTFNEALNMILISTDPALAGLLTDKWKATTDMIRKHSDDLKSLEKLIAPSKIIDSIQVDLETEQLVSQFLEEKAQKGSKTWNYDSLGKQFEFWLLEKGKVIKDKFAVKYLLYKGSKAQPKR